MIVYVVGDCGPEHNEIKSLYKTHEGALKAWNAVRLELIRKAKNSVRKTKWNDEMYEKIIEKLSCEDPEKIDNYPHETPYIQKYEIKD